MEAWQQEFAIVKQADQNRVFGFASVAISKNGEMIEDTQGDLIDPADLEEAAYQFVLKFREADELHTEEVVGHLIESFVFTPEKLEMLGIAKDAIPPRWWVGFEVSPDVFAKVKDGTYKMFSIGGTGERIAV